MFLFTGATKAGRSGCRVVPDRQLTATAGEIVHPAITGLSPLRRNGRWKGSFTPAAAAELRSTRQALAGRVLSGGDEDSTAPCKVKRPAKQEAPKFRDEWRQHSETCHAGL